MRNSWAGNTGSKTKPKDTIKIKQEMAQELDTKHRVKPRTKTLTR